MNGDRRFLLLAAHDLKRALDKIGYGDRMRADVAERIRVLRNVNEHWDERGGHSSVKFAAAGGVDPFAHRWGAGGTVLGEFVDVDELVMVAQKVYDELIAVEEGPAYRR